MVGLLGIEPSLHPPEGCVLPVYDSPNSPSLPRSTLSYQAALRYPPAASRCRGVPHAPFLRPIPLPPLPLPSSPLLFSRAARRR